MDLAYLDCIEATKMLEMPVLVFSPLPTFTHLFVHKCEFCLSDCFGGSGCCVCILGVLALTLLLLQLLVLLTVPVVASTRRLWCPSRQITDSERRFVYSNIFIGAFCVHAHAKGRLRPTTPKKCPMCVFIAKWEILFMCVRVSDLGS